MPIIMFHYVKSNCNYYHFDLNKFEDFVKANQEKIVTLQEYLNKADENNVVLSFDDGTSDHYDNVFPILKKYGVTGVFSVCDNIFNNKQLNIQKIHFLIERIGILKLYNNLVDCLPNRIYKKYKLLYEDKERFVKKILQTHLRYNTSSRIINKIAKINQIDFQKENLYMSPEQMHEMIESGNEFLYHTKHHLWLENLSFIRQILEIKNIKKYVKKYNFLNTLSLPFGSYNVDTLKICKKMGIDKILGIYNNTIKTDAVITRIDCNTLN